MAKNKEKIEKYKVVIEEEIIQKRTKIEIEIEQFRSEQESWEIRRKEITEKDRKYREDMEAELKRQKAALDKLAQDLAKDRLTLDILIQET